MTPKEARDIPTLAAMVAGMREEWGVAVTYPGLAEVVEWGYPTQSGALEEVELASTAFGAVCEGACLLGDLVGGVGGVVDDFGGAGLRAGHASSGSMM